MVEYAPLVRPEDFETDTLKLADFADAGPGEDSATADPELEAPIPLIKAALAVIPDDGTIAKDDEAYAYWITIGLATSGASGGSAEGLALFDAWSQRSHRYDAGAVTDKWRSFHPDRIGFGTLSHHADLADPTWCDRYDAQLDAEMWPAHEQARGPEPSSPPGESEPHKSLPGPAKDDDLGEWDAGERLSGKLPPPRRWLIAGLLCRTFLSGLVAPGDVGKTTLRLTQAIELATGRELLGVCIFGRCRVLVVSFEDDDDELHRRLLAICKHHKINSAELKGWLFCKDLNGGPKLAELDSKGRRRQIGKLNGLLRRAIARRDYGLVVLDPFVKLHALNENDNPDMDFVCSLLIAIAQDCNVAIDSPAHTHKGQIQAGDADARRGGSAQRDAGRLDYTFTVMSEDEAKRFGIPADERKRYMRLDKAKANIVRAMQARWFRLASVPLGNATTEYPDGDEVQAVERWEPPETWDGIESETLNNILDGIDAGMPNKRRYSTHNRATGRAAWKLVQQHCPDKNEAQCKEIIKQWCDAKVLVETSYDDPVTRKGETGLRVDPNKRPHY
jgi:hypothetical protein